MKLRKLTWVNWCEVIFGALVPTVVWVPGLALGLIGGLGAGVRHLQDVGPLILLIGGFCALVALWILLLCGSEQIVARPRLRIFVIGSGLLGYVAALWVIFAFAMSGLGWGSAPLWIVLFAPVVISFRYLSALLNLK